MIVLPYFSEMANKKRKIEQDFSSGKIDWGVGKGCLKEWGKMTKCFFAMR